MKTLGGSYFKFSLSQCKEKDAQFGLRIQEPFFLGPRKHSSGFSLAVSFQYKYLHSIFAVSADLPLSSTQETNEIEEIQINDTDQPKTVHVRFKLQKQCAFGQQFLLVGDDPSIGLWDPSDGVPMNWSDGHVWAAELDVPSNRVIKYKFLLKGETGAILWQQDPDRILETWDSEKTITVYEDWDYPELQNIIEEEILTDRNEEVLIHSEKIVENEQDLNINGTESGLPSFIDEKKEESFPGNGDMASNSFSSESTPVLVPGLIPMEKEEIGEAFADKEERNNVESTSIASEVEDLTEPELNFGETIEDMMDKKQQLNESAQIYNSILEGDKQWGRQILQKFLASFGFQIS